MTKTITVKDGRTLPCPTGTKTILPSGERVFYKRGRLDNYMGEQWEFTGRLKYESNTKWTETYCYVEVVHVWEEDHWLLPFITIIKKQVKYLPFDIFEYDYVTSEVVVECEKSILST